MKGDYFEGLTPEVVFLAELSAGGVTHANMLTQVHMLCK